MGAARYLVASVSVASVPAGCGGQLEAAVCPSTDTHDPRLSKSVRTHLIINSFDRAMGARRDQPYSPSCLQVQKSFGGTELTRWPREPGISPLPSAERNTRVELTRSPRSGARGGNHHKTPRAS